MVGGDGAGGIHGSGQVAGVDRGQGFGPQAIGQVACLLQPQGTEGRVLLALGPLLGIPGRFAVAQQPQPATRRLPTTRSASPELITATMSGRTEGGWLRSASIMQRMG